MMEKMLFYTEKDLQPIDFKDWLAPKALQLQPIVLKWVTEIENCGGDVQFIFHDGFPTFCVENAPFAYLNAFKAHVNIGFFYGAFLPDNLNLLEGNGKHMRHIKIKPDFKINETEVIATIKAAYSDIKNRLVKIKSVY